MKTSISILLAAGALAGCGARPAELAVAHEHVIRVVAKRFEYAPAVIHLKRGEPVVLELSTLDCAHGFDAPRLGLHAKILPDVGARLALTPGDVGRFPFHCDVFCGDGHEDMEGEIDVEE